jgi:hypothetical protein
MDYLGVYMLSLELYRQCFLLVHIHFHTGIGKTYNFEKESKFHELDFFG